MEERIKIPPDIIPPLYISCYSEDIFIEGYISTFDEGTLLLLGLGTEKRVKKFLIIPGVIFPFHFPKKTSYSSIPPIPLPIIKISYLF